MRRLVLMLVVLAGCVDNPALGESPDAAAPGPDAAATVDENECGIAQGQELVVIRQLAFVTQEGGVTRGLDIDGRTSTNADPEGCFKPDLRDEEGNEGIDNQFALIVPALLAFAGEGLTSAIQRTINEGAVLLMIGTDRRDDPDSDECLEVELFRAKGRPVIGGKGLIEPGQTFDRDTDKPSNFVPDAELRNGWIHAGPVSVGVPMSVAQFELFLTIEDATLIFTTESDGSARGIIAGALVMDELLAIVDQIDDGTELISGIRRVLADNADLEPDENGNCQKMSIAIEFDAAPAFLFPTETP